MGVTSILSLHPGENCAMLRTPQKQLRTSREHCQVGREIIGDKLAVSPSFDLWFRSAEQLI